MVFFKPMPLLENSVSLRLFEHFGQDFCGPLPFSLPLPGSKKCATKGGEEERRVREHGYCLLQP